MLIPRSFNGPNVGKNKMGGRLMPCMLLFQNNVPPPFRHTEQLTGLRWQSFPDFGCAPPISGNSSFLSLRRRVGLAPAREGPPCTRPSSIGCRPRAGTKSTLLPGVIRRRRSSWNFVEVLHRGETRQVQAEGRLTKADSAPAKQASRSKGAASGVSSLYP